MAEQPQFVEYPRPQLNQDKEIVRKAAKAYSLSSQATIIYLVLFVLAIVQSAAQIALLGFVLLGLLIFFAVRAVRASVAAADATGSSVAVAVIVTFLLVFVPCGALIVLFAQQARMGKILKAHGLSVGFNGPNEEQLQQYLRD